jgi:2'-5' RNA ligase
MLVNNIDNINIKDNINISDNANISDNINIIDNVNSKLRQNVNNKLMQDVNKNTKFNANKNTKINSNSKPNSNFSNTNSNFSNNKIKQNFTNNKTNFTNNKIKLIKLVKPENMHFTLQFLGEVSEQKLGQVQVALGNIEFKKFKVFVNRIGFFPNDKYVKIVWAGADSPELTQLAEKINHTLMASGFKEERAFSAHLTLARVKTQINTKKIKDKFKDTDFGTFITDKFYLMQSILSAKGAHYTVVEEYYAKD